MAIETKRAEYEGERAKIRDTRVNLLKAYLGRLAYQVNLLPTKEKPNDDRDETSPAYAELTAGIKMCVNELRLEYRALEPMVAMVAMGQADPQDEPPKIEDHNPLQGLRLVG